MRTLRRALLSPRLAAPRLLGAARPLRSTRPLSTAGGGGTTTTTAAPLAGPPAADDIGPGDVLWSMRDVAELMPAELKQALSRANMNQPQLNQLDVQAAIARWARFPGDTGSPEVQIAVATERIRFMARHMERNRKDFMTKRRIILAVAARNRMLKYLRRDNRPRYDEVVAHFGIRPNRAFDPTLPRRPKRRAGRPPARPAPARPRLSISASSRAHTLRHPCCCPAASRARGPPRLHALSE